MLSLFARCKNLRDWFQCSVGICSCLKLPNATHQPPTTPERMSWHAQPASRPRPRPRQARGHAQRRRPVGPGPALPAALPAHAGGPPTGPPERWPAPVPCPVYARPPAQRAQAPSPHPSHLKPAAKRSPPPGLVGYLEVADPRPATRDRPSRSGRARATTQPQGDLGVVTSAGSESLGSAARFGRLASSEAVGMPYCAHAGPLRRGDHSAQGAVAVTAASLIVSRMVCVVMWVDDAAARNGVAWAFRLCYWGGWPCLLYAGCREFVQRQPHSQHRDSSRAGLNR
jgi:hypothetical protein